jgi:GWxTD domain-containing protein
MKIRKLALFLSLLVPASLSSAGAQEKPTAAERDWLETVRPVMTSAERDIYLALATAADREKFVKFFWKHRDPVPETPENEFQKEFDERVRFADLNFRSGTGQKGSRTERGFHYLLLGKPLERHLYTTHSQMWPLELWYYKGEERFGLPPYFYLIFYQPQGLGDYRLYHPAVEGPEKLVVPLLFGQTLNRPNAYQFLREISSEVASASLSYIPGEGSERLADMSSLGSETVINAARGLAEKKFDDAYARTFADYKDFVETEYTDRFIGSNAMVKLFSQDGQPFVHWSVEPDRVSFVESGGMFHSAVEVVLKLETSSGIPLLERTEEVPVRLKPDEYKAHERRRLAFQDLVPVVPGELRLFLLLKNKTGKEFTSFNAALSVGEGGQGPRISNLLLVHGRENLLPSSPGRFRAFAFDGVQYVFNAKNEFLPRENLSAFVQVVPGEGPIPDAASFRLDLFAVDAAAAAASRTIPLRTAGRVGRTGFEVGPIPLSSLKPGYYRAELSLLMADGRSALAAKENFIILATPYPSLPWVFARRHSDYPNPEHLTLLGSQYFMQGLYPAARDSARKALDLREEPAARLLWGRSLYALKDYKASLEAVRPLWEGSKNREAAKIMALDLSAEGDWAGALPILEALMRESTEVGVLNLAAEAYLNTGQPAQAISLLEKSLRLVPGQPAVKAMLDRLRKGSPLS